VSINVHWSLLLNLVILSREIIALEVPGAKNEVHGRLEQFYIVCLTYLAYAFINFKIQIKIHLRIISSPNFEFKENLNNSALTLFNSQASTKTYIK
jgi:hypothetical protein